MRVYGKNDYHSLFSITSQVDMMYKTLMVVFKNQTIFN